MRPFRYELASDASAAIDLLAGEPGATFLAGGTNLVDLMKLEVERPDVLVDVTRVVSDRIEELPDGGVRIGACVRNNDLAVDPVIRERSQNHGTSTASVQAPSRWSNCPSGDRSRRGG